MHNLLFRKRLYDGAVSAALFAAIFGLVIFPAQSVAAAKDGLNLCLNVIIPSLFPFFVLSTMIVQLGLAQYLGKVMEPVMRPLFNVGGACSTAFVLGFIGGYPVGAKTVISLYENGNCSRAEAERLLSFCNNSGPAFIFGVVGAGVFSSSEAGLMLYLAHTAASVCIGLLFRRWGTGKTYKDTLPRPKTQKKAESKTFTAAFISSVQSSFQSTINICGFVIFFTVIIKLLFLSGALPAMAELLGNVFAPLGFTVSWAESFLTGLIELSSGVWTLQAASADIPGSIAMAAFMLGWAGLSIHCQVLSFIAGSGLSVRTYIMGKILHGILSAVFVFLLSNIFVFDSPVASYLADQVTGIASITFGRALGSSLVLVFLLSATLFAAALFSAKKAGKTR